jgi:hypothetical protein
MLRFNFRESVTHLEPVHSPTDRALSNRHPLLTDSTLPAARPEAPGHHDILLLKQHNQLPEYVRTRL